MKSQTIKYRNSNAVFIWICIIPSLLYFALFFFYPIIRSIQGSFFDWNALSGQSKFVGLGNYSELFKDEIVLKSFKNTFNLTFWAVLIKTVLALFVALGVDRIARGKSFYKTIYFMPTVCTMVATSFMFRFLFQPELGAINGMLSMLHMPQPGWLEDSKTAMSTIIIYTSWKDFGYVFLIFMAGLQDVPKDITEAAQIDGAKGLRKLWDIILPILKPVTLYNLVTQVIGSLQIFTSIMVLTNSARAGIMGGPSYSTTTTALYVYQKAFIDYRFGYASALVVVLFVVILSLTIFQLKVSKTDWGY